MFWAAHFSSWDAAGFSLGQPRQSYGFEIMSERICSERLEDIEQRCLTATAGPWKSWWEERDHGAAG